VDLPHFLVFAAEQQVQLQSFERVSSRVGQGGWPALSHYFVDERSQLDHATPVRQRRGTGLAFSGPTIRVFWEGRGFAVALCVC